jgi:hypothetical protein
MSPPKRSDDDHGKVRVRFMEFDLEGSNQTILEGIREITAALPGRTVVREVAPGTIKLLQNPAVAPAVAQPEIADFGDTAARDGEQGPERAASSPKPRQPRAPAKPPELSTDLRPEDSPMPVREFMETTQVTPESSVSDQVIAIATWLKEHRQRNEMSGANFYTCCKFLDWSPPSDPTSPMRNLKRDQKLASAGKGEFSLTLLGEKHFRDLKK